MEFDALQNILEPFLSPSSRTHWMGLLVFFIGCFTAYGCSNELFIAVWNKLKKERSIHLDIQLLVFNRIFRSVAFGGAMYATWWMSLRVANVLHSIVGEVEMVLTTSAFMILYSILLFVVEDATRFLLHKTLHRVPLFWKFHQVHHSATYLTPLTFFRVHPIESILYQCRSILSVGMVVGIMYWLGGAELTPLQLWGVPAFGFVLNTIFGNFRHSHIFLRFPNWVEHWFISPAQHQLHHSVESEHWNQNFGTWLSIWDKWSGSLLCSSSPPKGFGVHNSNHEQELLSALLSPFKPTKRSNMLIIGSTLLGLLVFVGVAHAEEVDDGDGSGKDANEDGSAESDDKETTEASAQIIVYGDDNQIKEAGSAHQVSEQALKQFEWNDIQQVLSMVPGVNTRTEDGFGLRPNIGIRGANSDRSAKVTLMEDGVLFAPAPYAAPAAYFFPMTTRLVGVEVFKGASSTRYGPQTVGGAVNLLTRSIPTETKWGADASFGDFNTLKVHSFIGGEFSNWGVLAEASHLQSDGFKELESNTPTGFSRTDTMLKVARRNAQHTVQVKLGFAREESNETYLGLSTRDFESTPLLRYPASQEGLMSWTRTQAELSWIARPTKQWLLQTIAYHHYLDRSWRKFNGFASGVDVHNLLQQDPTSGEGALYLSILRGQSDALLPEEYLQIGTNDRQFHSFGVQNTSIIEHVGESHSHRLEFGIRAHGDVVRRQHTEQSAQMIAQDIVYVDGTNASLLDSHVGAMALALYVHDDWSMNNLHVFPSFRNETIQTSADVDGWTEPITRNVSLPGLGTMWEFDDWVDVFTSVHRGFSPVAPEQEASVLPEISWNYELGFRQHMDETTSELIFFANDYRRITGQCTLSSGCDVGDVGRQFTGGKALIAGLESVFRWEHWMENGWTIPIQVQYSFTHATFRDDFYSGFPQFGMVQQGYALPYVAKHQGSASVGIKTEDVSLNAMTTYRGEMLDSANVWMDSTSTLPKLWTLDLSGNWTVVKDWQVYGTWNNVTNVQAVTSWRPFGARPVTPTAIYVGMKKSL